MFSIYKNVSGQIGVYQPKTFSCEYRLPHASFLTLNSWTHDSSRVKYFKEPVFMKSTSTWWLFEIYYLYVTMDNLFAPNLQTTTLPLKY